VWQFGRKLAKDQLIRLLEKRERDWINNRGRVNLGGSQTKQAKSWRRAEVVEPRKRLRGRQERDRAMAQGQGDLLVRAKDQLSLFYKIIKISTSPLDINPEPGMRVASAVCFDCYKCIL
jgi:hypothetical protein